MIRNFNADGKLSTIIDRNSERRKSLSLDDEYHDKEPLHRLEYQYESATKLHEADDPVSTSSESILQSFENGELNSEPLMTKLDQIHNAAHIRLRRRKIKDHDRIEINSSKVEKDKFRSGFRGRQVLLCAVNYFRFCFFLKIQNSMAYIYFFGLEQDFL